MFQRVDASFRLCILVLTLPPEAAVKLPGTTYFRGFARAVAGAVHGSSGHGCLG